VPTGSTGTSASRNETRSETNSAVRSPKRPAHLGSAERADVCALGVPTATYDKSRPADLVGVVMQVLHGVGHGPGTDDVLDRG
jgi:hypothetical protein